VQRPYHVLDVFTDTPLCGNPLAVVLDADGLSDARMQAIAREFNLSETVFVLRPRDNSNTARLRIFTPATELPFAGHPTVGAAVLLAQLRAGDLLGSTDVTLALEENVGLVTCDVRGAAPVSKVQFALPQMPSALPHDVTAADAARALGLDAHEIGFDAHRPSAFTAGVPFSFVPIVNADAIARAQPTAVFADVFGAAGSAKAYLYTRETENMAHDFHARMFGQGVGVREDPATGSAVAAFAGVVAAFENLPIGLHRLVIEQGYEMLRPSLIMLTVEIHDGGLVAASLGGSAVRLAEGTLLV
jgi:trans-2,3-dihydro-3-hydroxyanthranilate isomerase